MAMPKPPYESPAVERAIQIALDDLLTHHREAFCC